MTFKFIDPEWALSAAELNFLKNYRGKNRFQGALFLKYFQKYACFPAYADDIVLYAVRSVTDQLNCTHSLHELDFNDRTAERQRHDVRAFLGFRLSNSEDYRTLQNWLASDIIQEPDLTSGLYEAIVTWCLQNKVENLSSSQQERIIKGALVSFEEHIFAHVLSALSEESCVAIDGLFSDDGSQNVLFSLLKNDPGKASVNSVMKELLKLEAVDRVEIQADIFASITDKTITKYRMRASTESAWEMRRHPDGVRYTLAVAFLLQRRREIIDGLVELMIQTIHKIKIRSEKRVTKEIAGNAREVANKKMLLFKLAEAALDNPEGSIRDVLFPVVSEETFEDLVKEFRADRPVYNEKVQVRIRNSYKNHYRQIVPPILEALTFRCNNQYHRPVIEALDYLGSIKKTQRKIRAREVPIQGVIPKSFQPFLIVYDEKKNDEFIDRINYEICVLQALRDGLRCREIWVEGAYKFRNPDDDVPKDFETKRDAYYQDLNLPLKGTDFIGDLRVRLEGALTCLNANITRNPKVSIRPHGKNRIHVSPLEPQPEPQFLHKLKGEVTGRWPLTGLLDIVKEADMQTGFTQCFKGLGDRQILDQSTLQPRLLLTLYALGTNTGLKRVLAGGGGQFTYPELRHVRYRGRGVMVYWHVEKNSLCIYSQLKRCSSSEVGAMIEGVLRHCTDMEIEKQYVDSHGQSEVAFAFCELLGFSLMPRLKAIATQKLYLPEVGMVGRYSNLTPILNRPINWDLIANQYDQIVKYTAALQKGTADADSILKRFTRNNRQHPTYHALAELGRAIKTIFLCEYLESEETRREIHEALNVVENCNSTVEFIFFARNSELSSNQLANQEISILALHLLQVCLVYVNTLMIQDVLNEEKWIKQMQKEDFRALTPLIYQHVTPYGAFDLDMKKRIFDDPSDLKIAA